jgi:hypothetical protein
MENQFKAPQKSLVSSWKSEPFSRKKKPLDLVKKSLGNKPQSMVYHRGNITKATNSQHSNLY